MFAANPFRVSDPEGIFDVFNPGMSGKFNLRPGFPVAFDGGIFNRKPA